MFCCGSRYIYRYYLKDYYIGGVFVIMDLSRKEIAQMAYKALRNVIDITREVTGRDVSYPKYVEVDGTVFLAEELQ